VTLAMPLLLLMIAVSGPCAALCAVLEPESVIMRRDKR
jgi:hypothetical protein